MTINQIREKVASSKYDFLRTNKHLGTNIILLTIGGSHAYGMDKETSDLDCRGIALNGKKEILLGTDFEQVVDLDTDTTVYSFNKMIDFMKDTNMSRKHNIKAINLQIDDIEGFDNDNHTGFIISWSSDIGFGEYTVWKDKTENEFKLNADSECMDLNDDKEFISELMRLFVNKLMITS